MITQLRLKNWRSLRDVTIDDLQPINVFIGANSSGKTNIIDALYFTREMFDRDIIQAVYSRGGGEKIRTLGSEVDEPVEIEFTCRLPRFGKLLSAEFVTWFTGMTFTNQPYDFRVRRTLLENDNVIFDDPSGTPAIDNMGLPTRPSFFIASKDSSPTELRLHQLGNYVGLRWQMLNADFMPPLNLSTAEVGNIYVLDRFAANLPFILNHLRNYPVVYSELQSDLRYLLDHVKEIRVQQDEREARLSIHENNYPNIEAPTVSSGTARILAMLSAYYVLDIPTGAPPGLVVIEEPDTALNPGLLKNFVELLREYVSREEPRQFILTTHNPAFLNYFRPEEVRIVSRDEHGYTTVNRVPDYIRDIWLDEHGLGEVWLTNAFGGVPE